MIFNNKRKPSFPYALKPALTTFLYTSLFSAISMSAYSHPETSNKDPEAERAEQMTDKRNQIRARSLDQRERAQERAATVRKDANKRRERHKQKAALRRAESNKAKEKHLAFKTDLLEMLENDDVINSKSETVKITYADGHPVVNDIDLSERFGDKYENLWMTHDRTISDKSYINIGPGSYEIREITMDGASRHFVMQTN